MMRKSRTGVFLIGLTVLALSAGVVAGMLVARLPAAPAENPVILPPAFERSLGDTLGLNKDQREEMRTIWEGVRGNVHRIFDEAQQLQDRQLDELAGLMKTPEEKEAFATIAKKYADRYAQLKQERQRLFDDAVSQTNKILTPEQQKKYADFRRNLGQASTQPTTVSSTSQ
jgi:Spy/CpxP family protein refolding chaperone